MLRIQAVLDHQRAVKHLDTLVTRSIARPCELGHVCPRLLCRCTACPAVFRCNVCLFCVFCLLCIFCLLCVLCLLPLVGCRLLGGLDPQLVLPQLHNPAAPICNLVAAVWRRFPQIVDKHPDLCSLLNVSQSIGSTCKRSASMSAVSKASSLAARASLYKLDNNRTSLAIGSESGSVCASEFI